MNAETMRCPTCRAGQVRSDVCRRCKSDLRLLGEIAEAFAALRERCLTNVRHNRTRAALDDARECLALRADDDTLRLLAVCELLNGNWAAARSHAVQLLAERPAVENG
ncbi:MAG: hypothetical protein K2V38_11670 [Gemmataceae bacterium]|nr:hypothetical protein [Gemmataceae bacterium]